MLGIIGGSGFYELMPGKETKVKTKYGQASVVLGNLSAKPCAFIARHGKTHTIPPHMINHLGNISALKSLGVTEILSISSVGIIGDYEPGDLVLVRDFISLTGASPTFFDDFAKGITHVDMTEPYDSKLAGRLMEAAKIEGIGLEDDGILAHTAGPRFETKAEISALKKMGANLVGMTSVPEAILSNELGIRFANLASATNYAAGISDNKLSMEEVFGAMKKRKEDIAKLTSGLIKLV